MMGKSKDVLTFMLWTLKNMFHYGFIPAVLYLGFKKGTDEGMPKITFSRMEISAGNIEPRNPEALPGASMLVDGYLWGGCLTNNAKDLANPFQNPCQMTFLSERRHLDAYSDDLNDRITPARKEQKVTSHLKEYNTQYSGLTIIPWEDFALNPTQINDLFHLEKTGFITFDPEEVNVFFHATRMNKPQLGQISENGGAW